MVTNQALHAFITQDPKLRSLTLSHAVLIAIRRLPLASGRPHYDKPD